MKHTIVIFVCIYNMHVVMQAQMPVALKACTHVQVHIHSM